MKGTTNDQLRSIVERVERLHEERDGIASDIKDVFAEAKGNGYDVKALKAVIAARRQDPDKRAVHEQIVDTYMAALGMIPALAGVQAHEAEQVAA